MEELKSKVDFLSKTALVPAAPPLDADETKAATRALVKPLYRAVCRVKTDPAIQGQQFGLISFTPAAGVQPNRWGVYGTAKIRGNYGSDAAAESAAEEIVREVDSANPIYTVRVGQEFPLTQQARFVENFSTIDLSKHVDEVEARRAREEREKEKKDRKKIIDREQQLLKEHKQILDGEYEEDPLDVYIRAHVKRSQLKWTLQNTEERIEKEIKPALAAAVAEIREMDARDASLRGQYKDRYLEARREAGLETEFKCDTGTQIDFLKFLDDE